MVNHRVDQCWNQCCKTSIHWRSVNEKSTTIMLSDFKSATIIQACIRSATITNMLHCLFNMEFLTFIGHSDYVGDGVEKWLITGLINAGINVVRLQFIGDL